MSINVVLVDRNDVALGLKDKLEAHKHPVFLHRAVSVIIYDKSHKKMLLQKRSGEKPTWPNFWTNATCTHPLPEESYQDAAERRLKEEMGIVAKLTEVFRFCYKAKYDGVFGEHELDVVFIGEYEGEVEPNPSEVGEYKWILVTELKTDIEKNPNLYTPWFKMIINRLH